MDPYELPRHISGSLERLVDPPSEGFEVRIERAHDHAGMIRPLTMETEEVLAVEGQEDAALFRRQNEQCFGGNGLLGQLALHPSESGRVGEHRQQILTLQIGVVVEDLVDGYAGPEQFEHRLDGIAQATDAGFVVADVGIEGDAPEEGGLVRWGGRGGRQASW